MLKPGQHPCPDLLSPRSDEDSESGAVFARWTGEGCCSHGGVRVPQKGTAPDPFGRFAPRGRTQIAGVGGLMMSDARISSSWSR